MFYIRAEQLLQRQKQFNPQFYPLTTGCLLERDSLLFYLYIYQAFGTFFEPVSLNYQQL